MKTEIFAEHCVRAGDVVVSPRLINKDSDDYLTLTIIEAIAWASLPWTAANQFRLHAGRAVLRYRADSRLTNRAGRAMRRLGIEP